MTLRVGITGGIGSGKTTVCKIFSALDIPIYYADDRAKTLMVNDEDLKAKLIDVFGKETYHTSGELNRAHLAGIVFKDEAALKKLNALVHPAVKKDGLEWEKTHTEVPYTLREAALIYESGIDKTLDNVIVVTAPEELRIQRVMRRDGVDEAAVRNRIDKQWPEEDKVKRADFVIHNDGEHSLIKQILEIHKILVLAHQNNLLE